VSSSGVNEYTLTYIYIDRERVLYKKEKKEEEEEANN
jgi:hypothetical protein